MTHQIASTLLENSRIHIGFMPEAADINRQIMDAYVQLREEDWLRRSHFFDGRYENLYLHRERIQAIGRVLEQAESYAKNLLQKPDEKLRSGFWINDMGPNEATTEHDHDDYDEMLSGVYYVQVPQESGELVVVDRHSRTLVTPQPGMFVFFAPNVLHSVSINRSGERRISIGMNFGPVAD
ncbi:MAG TPA: putative 2OG-Fe(II) oxygenase [Gallionellaceae bacterium]|nr:putative 2OG-Fe(II) oxygenase [Gallionellaceae bacterium]